MKIAVYNQQGEKKTDITLSPAFDVKVSSQAVTLYINYLRAALRFPIANTKDRGQVSGGGRKPYKQKGTGNARAGSNRSPLWVGGGVTFGPNTDRNYHIRINAKQKKQVILGILADLIRDKKVKAVDDFAFSEIKTKYASTVLDNLEASGKTAVIVMPSDTNTILSYRNIAGAYIMTPNKLDMVNLLSSETVIISKEALTKYEELYSINKANAKAEEVVEEKEETTEAPAKKTTTKKAVAKKESVNE